MVRPHTVYEPLRRWEKAGLFAFLLLVIGFGVMVEIRSAYQKTRKTDLGCYSRAGWAIRADKDIYTVQDDNWWHFAYPPAFAIAMVPLADAPKGEPRDGMLPYPLSVAIWFVISVICLAWAVHSIASALEYHSGIPTGCRAWWYHRFLPIYICIAPIGCTLSRGQVNLLLIMLAGGMFAAAVRGRRFSSGLWLSAAICLKLIPAFLLVVPIWRRDGRALLGVLAGLVVGGVLFPASVIGFAGTWKINHRMYESIILPGLAEGTDKSRARELMELNATDNQSIQATVHYYRHWDRLTRPGLADVWTKLAHVGIGGLLTLGLILAYGRHRPDDPIRLILFVGGLVVVMAIISPVSHTHYFCLALPAVMGLCELSRRRCGSPLLPSAGTLAYLILVGLLFGLPMIPFWEHRREAGLPILGCLILWTATMSGLLWTRKQVSKVSAAPALPTQLKAAA